MEETLELYVWPGVSDLVSIDAECIAIIYFLRYRFSNEQNIAWRITSTHDPTIIPTSKFDCKLTGCRTHTNRIRLITDPEAWNALVSWLSQH